MIADYPWIIFDINGTEYGINSKYVLSIEMIGEITPIIDAPNHCPGIIHSRGDMIELLDLRVLFGLGSYASAGYGDQNDRYMMVVVETGHMKRGIVVDQIVSVEYITRFEANVMGSENVSGYISQIAKREKLDKALLIIRPESLFTS